MEGSLVAYKVFTNGSTLQASEINDNLMRQSVMVFSNAAARTAAITTPLEGMLTWLEDVNRYESYNGSAWSSPFGTTLLGTSIFTSQTSVAFDNIFTADYRYYEFFFTAQGGTSGVQLRLRSGATDLSTSSYVLQNLGAGGVSASASTTTSDSWNIMTARTARPASVQGALFNPFAVAETQLNTQAGDATPRIELNSGYNSSAASYNGIRFFVASGTISGSAAVYGRKF
jgi:hypothetical protein